MIIQPTIKAGTIEVNIGPDNRQQAEEAMKVFGNVTPLIKFGEIIIGMGDLLRYSFSVDYNELPIIEISIDDSYGRFGKIFSDDKVLTGTLFLGNMHWYHKYDLQIIDTIKGGDKLHLICEMVLPLYERAQVSFNDRTILDIFKEIAEDTGLGFYSNENSKTNKPIKNFMCPNFNYLGLIENIVENHSFNNFWCIDQNYFLHLQNYDALINKEVDKYTIRANSKLDEPTPIILTNYHNGKNSIEEEEKKIQIRSIQVNNDLGNTNLNTAKSYSVNGQAVESFEGVGNSSKGINTFSEWQELVNPFYKEILEKEISGNKIELELYDSLPELFPFMVVELEIYSLSEGGDVRIPVLNKAQSGKKIVMGYDIVYIKDEYSDDPPIVTQVLRLI